MLTLSEHIITNISDITQPIVSRIGVEILEIQYLSNNKLPVLQLIIDKPIQAGPQSRVTIDECAQVSRDLSLALEAEEVFPDPYRLEVSSPGLDRPLKIQRDFLRNMGQKIIVHFKNTEPKTETSKSRVLSRHGVISGFDNECVILSCKKTELRIPVENITSAKLDISF